MKKLFIAANFKSNKTKLEIDAWLDFFVSHITLLPPEKTVLLFPPALFIPQFAEAFKQKPQQIFYGLQNISQFSQGAYTGEICGENAAGFGMSHVIIGHSERRTYFHETDDELAQKVLQAKNAELTPLYCVPDATTPVPKQVSLVAYEPVSAIGSGSPDTPHNANSIARSIKDKFGDLTVMYGGSVTPENVSMFTREAEINGVLVGGASLNSETFLHIVQNA